MPLELLLFIFLAFLVGTVTGFGSTILSLALASHLVPIDRLVTLLVPLNIVLSCYLVGRYHRSVRLDLLLERILPAMGVGLAVGLVLFHLGKSDELHLAFAILVILLALWELSKMRGQDYIPEPLGRKQALGFLFGGGVVHGIYATGGPMVVYWLGREKIDKAEFRATLSALWGTLGIVLLATYFRSGLLGASWLKDWLSLLPAWGVALLVGEWVHRKLNLWWFRLLTFIILLLAGVFQLYKAL